MGQVGALRSLAATISESRSAPLGLDLTNPSRVPAPGRHCHIQVKKDCQVHVRSVRSKRQKREDPHLNARLILTSSLKSLPSLNLPRVYAIQTSRCS